MLWTQNTSTYYEYNMHVFHFNLHVISTEALHLGLRSAVRASENPQGGKVRTAQAWVAWNPQQKEKSNSRRHTPHTLTSTKQGGRSKRCSSKVLENWLLFKHKKLILSQEHSTKSSMDSENVFLNVGIRIMLNVRTKLAMTVGIAFAHREKENTWLPGSLLFSSDTTSTRRSS